jgi:uncharacterized protein YecE (DUF72 family)
MARLLVGLPALLGDIQRYKKRFDMVELRPVDSSLPRIATLRGWRKNVPPGFVFSVVLPRAVGEVVEGRELDEALQTSLEAATAVEARCLVLATTPAVRPTAQNRKKLLALFARLPQEGVVIAWEPSGIWEREDVIALARAGGVIPVLDAAREPIPPGPIAYTRLRALGKGSALGAAAIQRVADHLRGRREAFVIVEGAMDATRVRAGLLEALAKSKVKPAGGMLVKPISSPLLAEDEEQ